jgi:hypothetical protein
MCILTWFWVCPFWSNLIGEMSDLWIAAYDGDIKRVRDILDAGAEINEKKVEICVHNLFH